MVSVSHAGDVGSFFAAAQRGDRDLVATSLDAGVNPNARDNNGRTALMLASGAGHDDLVRSLLSHGADPNLVVLDRWSAGGTTGETALMFAAEKGHAEVCRLLIANGAAVNARSKGDGWTALMRATRKGDVEAVRVLLSQGADPNTVGAWKGERSMLMAARGGRADLAKLLIEFGAELDVRDEHGQTPLMHAAKRGDVDTTRLLVQAGADKSFRDRWNRAATDLAMAKGLVAVVSLLEPPDSKNAAAPGGSDSVEKLPDPELLYPKEAWKFEAGVRVASGPFVENRTVLLSTWDERLHALDIHTGRKIWTFRRPQGRTSRKYGPVARPIVRGNSLYVRWVNHDTLYAIDMLSGRLTWSFKAHKTLRGVVERDGALYVGALGSVYAIDARTGKQLWRFATEHKPVETPVVEGDVVVAGSIGGNLFAIAAESGKLLWKFGGYSVADEVLRFHEELVKLDARAKEADPDGMYATAIGVCSLMLGKELPASEVARDLEAVWSDLAKAIVGAANKVVCPPGTNISDIKRLQQRVGGRGTPPRETLASRPVSGNGNIYASMQDKDFQVATYGLAAADGKVRFRHRHTATHSRGLLKFVLGTLYLTDGNDLVALRGDDGSYLWALDLEGEGELVSVMPVSDKIMLFSPLALVDSAKGKITRTFDDTDSFELCDGTERALCVRGFKKVMRVDRESGIPKWQAPVRYYFGASNSIALANGMVLYAYGEWVFAATMVNEPHWD